jgi:uncharacterized repeat protein (TIGR03803 family)
MSNKTNKRILLALLWTGTVTAAWAQSSPELRTLYSFTQSVNGVVPNNGVTIGAGGVVYGTTAGGGKHNAGVVYSLTPTGIPGRIMDGGGYYQLRGQQRRRPGESSRFIGRGRQWRSLWQHNGKQ